MIIEVRLPEISENVKSGEVVMVLVKAGETVRKEQPLVELETEKAVVQVPSPEDGVVKEIKVSPGDTIEVGGLVATLETDARAAGKPKEKKVEPARTVPEDEMKQERSGKEPSPEMPVPPPVRESPPKSGTGRAGPETPIEPVPASPSVRRLARELGVDIGKVKGSGPGGRVSDADVKAHVKNRSSTGREEPAAESPPLPDFLRWGAVKREKMSQVRRITARTMAFAWRTIPHVTQFDEAVITTLLEFIEGLKPRAAKEGGKLTVTAAVLKVLAGLLRRYPAFNASLDTAAGEIVYKDYINIGVAVDTERGLLVPVVRDADKKGLVELAVEITRLADKARDRKILPDELEGGTITVTNIGGFGGTGFTPIIYWPQTAILGIARAAERPVVEKGAIAVRTVLPLSLSYDHRLIDGASGARFLRALKDALENPYTLLL